MAVSKASNTMLGEMLTEAGLSHASLAYRVNTLAAASGLPAPRYNHASVARWLRGEQPRGRTPDLVAAVFTSLLGRPVTRADLGMRAASLAPDFGLAYEPDLATAITTVTDLYGTDVHRRDLLARTGYTATAFVMPALRFMTAPARVLTEHAGRRRVGAANVAAIREVTATFRRLDNLLGGGYARTTVVQYLADEVGPMLRHGSYTGETGRGLFSAAAELTLLAGWMAFDLEQHPIAQRYLIQALRLAHEAGDEALGGEVLAAMSCQAVYLGDGGAGVDMARTAARSARRSGCGQLLAEALVSEAHGHAAAGDRRQAGAVLASAHVALDRARPADAPAWLGYFDAAYLSARTGRVLLASGDAAPAAGAMREALRMREGFNRGHVFNLLVLAAALFEGGSLGEGAAAARRAVRAADGVESVRVTGELGALAGRLDRYAGTAEARELLPVLRDVSGS